MGIVPLEPSYHIGGSGLARCPILFHVQILVVGRDESKCGNGRGIESSHMGPACHSVTLSGAFGGSKARTSVEWLRSRVVDVSVDGGLWVG